MVAMPRHGLGRLFVAVGLVASLVSAAGDGAAKEKKPAKRRSSTAAERTAAAKAARELEVDPLGPEADGRRKVAMVVLDAPDIQVPLCANALVSFADETSARHGLLLQQMLFSTMAFMIEQPEHATDSQAVFLAGILGALKAYGKVRQIEPAERSPFLDKMLELQKRGTLEAYYRKETEACAGTPAAPAR